MGKNVFLVIFRKNEGMNGDFPFSENNECWCVISDHILAMHALKNDLTSTNHELNWQKWYIYGCPQAT